MLSQIIYAYTPYLAHRRLPKIIYALGDYHHVSRRSSRALFIVKYLVIQVETPCLYYTSNLLHLPLSGFELFFFFSYLLVLLLFFVFASMLVVRPHFLCWNAGCVQQCKYTNVLCHLQIPL